MMSARGAWLSRTSLTAVLAAALAVVGTGLPAAQAAAGRPQALARGPVGRQWPSFARHNADMIYDAADQDVVLFGGFGGRYLGDTWTWNGSTWTQQDTATAPEPRDTGSFAYDAATGTGILYGGYDGNIPAFTDTWSWNGSAWHRLHPTARPGRVSAAWQMTGDPATGQVMLFGGQRANHTNADATWAWNGTTWTQLSPAASPRGRGLGAMSYDSATQQIVMFGGQDADQDGYPASSWAWNGTTWHRLT